MLATRILCAVGLAPVSVTVIRRTEFDFRVLELYVRDPSCILFPKTPGGDHPLRRQQIKAIISSFSESPNAVFRTTS